MKLEIGKYYKNYYGDTVHIISRENKPFDENFIGKIVDEFRSITQSFTEDGHCIGRFGPEDKGFYQYDEDYAKECSLIEEVVENKKLDFYFVEKPKGPMMKNPINTALNLIIIVLLAVIFYFTIENNEVINNIQQQTNAITY